MGEGRLQGCGRSSVSSPGGRWCGPVCCVTIHLIYALFWMYVLKSTENRKAFDALYLDITIAVLKSCNNFIGITNSCCWNSLSYDTDFSQMAHNYQRPPPAKVRKLSWVTLLIKKKNPSSNECSVPNMETSRVSFQRFLFFILLVFKRNIFYWLQLSRFFSPLFPSARTTLPLPAIHVHESYLQVLCLPHLPYCS